MTIARLEEKRDGLLGNEDAYLAVQKEIDARKELLALIGSKEARKAAEESAKDAARAWERAAADINRSLTDALLRGFESGKSFARNLRPSRRCASVSTVPPSKDSRLARSASRLTTFSIIGDDQPHSLRESRGAPTRYTR